MKYLTFVLFGFLSFSQIVWSADWESTDIGAVAAAGSASTDDRGGFVVNGSGEDIWNTADEFQFVYLPVQGDVQIVGRVLSLQNTDPWAKAGFMVRETFAANSPNVMVFLTPIDHSGLHWRSSAGGVSSYTAGPALPFPYWIKLVRAGNTFTAYRSADGANWATVGSTTVSMASSAFVGLAVTSHRDGTLTQARYDNVTVIGSTTTNIPPPTGTNAPPSGPTNGVPPAPTNLRASPTNSAATSNRIDLTWTDNATNETGYRVERSTNGVNFQSLTLLSANMTSFSDINLPSGTRFWYRVFASNDAGDSAPSNVADATTMASGSPPLAGFQGRDIGAVAAAGHYGQNQDLFSVWGSGADIWGSADEFFFVHASVTGDFQMAGRITQMDNTDPWAKAGFMARETLNANSRNFMVFRVPSSNSGVQARTTTGGPSTSTQGGTAPAPQWFRLTRTGNTFNGYRSSNGSNWTLIGSSTMSLPNTIYVGMAVTSHADGRLCNAIFDHVTTPFNAPPSGGTNAPPSGATNGVPLAPTNLRASPTNSAATSNRIDLTWNDNATNETSYRVERSTNGVNFQSLTLLNANMTSFSDINLPSATRYWYRVFASNDAGDSAPSNVADATTTASSTPPSYDPPRGQDIGAVAVPGGHGANQDLVSIWGSGADIWGTSDEFYFFHFPATGDFEMVVSTQNMENTDPWAKAGIMARETLDANSRNFMVFRRPSTQTGVQWRSAVGGTSSSTAGGFGNSSLFWLKLVRIGNTFSGYWSADGQNWNLIASNTMPLASTLRVGLAVTSHRDGVLCHTTFTDVEGPQPIGASGGGGGGSGVPAAPSNASVTLAASYVVTLMWQDNSTNETSFRVERSTNGVNFAAVANLPANSTRFDEGNLTPSTHYWYRVFAVNNAGDSPPSNVAEATTAPFTSPSNYLHQDIGAVSRAGSFSQSGDTYTVAGSGADIWGTSDEFHYAYRNVTGFRRIIARIDGMANTSPWAKAGVMIRTSLDPGALNVMLALTPEHGLAFQWRGNSGAQTTYVDAGPASAPVWVMLVAGGSSPASPSIDALKSSDGVHWTKVGSVPMYFGNSPVLAGMAVTSHNDGTLCTANFSYVTIDGGQ